MSTPSPVPTRDRAPSSRPRPRVLAAVGTTPGPGLLREIAQEARRRDADILLLHVQAPPEPEGHPERAGTADPVEAERMVAAARAGLTALLGPRFSVTTEIAHGEEPASAVARRTDDTTVLVVLAPSGRDQDLDAATAAAVRALCAVPVVAHEPDDRPPSFRLLPPDRCYDLLATTVVGRVAFLASSGLQLLPVNYRVLERSVLISTAEDGTLAGLSNHRGEVLFEVDYHAPLGRHGWSVLMRTTSARVDDARTLADATRLRLVPWAPARSAVVLRLRPHRVTGREVDLRGGTT